MVWLYDGKEFTSEDIGDYQGFVYLITNQENGKHTTVHLSIFSEISNSGMMTKEEWDLNVRLHACVKPKVNALTTKSKNN